MKWFIQVKAKTFLFLILVLSLKSLYAQEMTLEKTIIYINSALSENSCKSYLNGSENTIYNSEGEYADDVHFEIKVINSQIEILIKYKNSYKQNVYSSKKFSFNINDVTLDKQLKYNGFNQYAILIICENGDCIKVPNMLINSLSFAFESETIMNRLFNSFTHLKYLLQQKTGNNKTIDPFDQYDPNANTIPYLTYKNIVFTDQNNNKRIDQNEQAFMQFDLMNEGKGKAENVKLLVVNKSNIKGVNFQNEFLIPLILPNQKINVKIPINSTNELSIGQAEFQVSIQIKDKEIGKAELSIATFNSGSSKNVVSTISDSDIEIPSTGLSKPNCYALVIGNEDYTTKQPQLKKESNVDYAINDARIFKEYLVKTLGVPNINITYLVNATSAEMKQAVSKIKQLILINPSSEIILYYAGHGLPNEGTKEQYLIPVDVNGSNLSFGIKLDDLITELTENPCKRVTLFIDACFSGGARNQSLLASRGVKIKPKQNVLNGNLVVFAASSADESSLSFPDKQHGIFTYYLLKRLKETRGVDTYEDFFNYIYSNVREKSILINNQLQTPSISVSPLVDDKWKSFRF